MGAIEQLLKILENVTPRRFMLLVGLLTVLVLGGLFYERYTASFALTRLEKSVALLRQLEASPSSAGREKEIAEINKRLITQFHALIVEDENRALARTLLFPVPDHAWLWKFTAGALPWLLLSIATFLESRRKVDNAFTAFLYAQIGVLFFAGLGALLPTIGWPWFNLVIYPSSSVVLVLLVVAIPAFRSTRERSQERAITNNLKQLSAASDQYFLEHGVATVPFGEIVGSNKYIRSLVSIAGESYDHLIIEQGKPITVVTKDGRAITYHA